MAKKAKKDEGAGRRLEDDGVRLVIPCYIELRDWWNAYAAARAYQRERAGEAVNGGEKKGAGASLARAICWLSTLNDADLERIDREGGDLLAELSRLAADYGKVPGRADPATIPRRTASVFAPVPTATPTSGPGGGAVVVLKPVGLHHHRAADELQGQDVAAEGDGEPGGRS